MNEINNYGYPIHGPRMPSKAMLEQESPKKMFLCTSGRKMINLGIAQGAEREVYHMVARIPVNVFSGSRQSITYFEVDGELPVDNNTSCRLAHCVPLEILDSDGKSYVLAEPPILPTIKETNGAQYRHLDKMLTEAGL